MFILKVLNYLIQKYFSLLADYQFKNFSGYSLVWTFHLSLFFFSLIFKHFFQSEICRLENLEDLLKMTEADWAST